MMELCTGPLLVFKSQFLNMLNRDTQTDSQAPVLFLGVLVTVTYS